MRLRVSQLLVKDNIPAGCNPLVLFSLAYMYRSSGRDAEPIVVTPAGPDLWRVEDGRHRYFASVIAGRPDVLAVEQAAP